MVGAVSVVATGSGVGAGSTIGSGVGSTTGSGVGSITAGDWILVGITDGVNHEICKVVSRSVDTLNFLNGVEGQGPATHDAVNKRFVYEFPIGTTLKKGKWRAWSYATMTDGRKLPGEPDTFTVRAEGT